MTDRGQVRRLSATEVTHEMPALAQLRLGKGFNARSAQSRRDLVGRLREIDLPEDHVGSREPSRSHGEAGDDAAITRCAQRCGHTRAMRVRNARTTRGGRSDMPG